MGDLISRTELLKMLQYNAKGETDENGEYRKLVAIDINKLIDYIYHMPTAYDVEALVSELNETGRKFCENVGCSKECENCEHGALMRTIIEIVRGKE